MSRRVRKNGAGSVSNKFWVASCNEFKFYEALAALSGSIAVQAHTESISGSQPVNEVAAPIMEEAREALIKAMTQLVAKSGENYVAQSGLKVVIKRLMPYLNETILGCANFSDFLSRSPAIATVVDKLSGGHVALLQPSSPSLPSDTASPQISIAGPLR